MVVLFDVGFDTEGVEGGQVGDSGGDGGYAGEEGGDGGFLTFEVACE